MLLDQPVEMQIDEIQTRSRAPVAQQPRLDVFELQRLAQQGIRVEVDLPDRKIVRGAPVGVHGPQFFRS
jgi:hypothetical protein